MFLVYGARKTQNHLEVGIPQVKKTTRFTVLQIPERIRLYQLHIIMTRINFTTYSSDRHKFP